MGSPTRLVLVRVSLAEQERQPVKLCEVRRYAMGLSDVTEEPHHEFSSFRVRGKIFVTVPPSEDRIHVFVSELEREKAVEMYPAWAEKLIWGGKVVGVKVHLDAAVPAAVRYLVQSAWLFKAPAAVAKAAAMAPKATAPGMGGLARARGDA